MKKTMWMAAAVLGALLIVPGYGLAAQTKPASKPAQAAKTASAKSSATKSATMATHSMTGVVKSVDDTSLVITSKNKDTTFALDNATKREGNVAVGSTVHVQYHMDGAKNIATDVMEKAAKAGKGKAKSKH